VASVVSVVGSRSKAALVRVLFFSFPPPFAFGLPAGLPAGFCQQASFSRGAARERCQVVAGRGGVVAETHLVLFRISQCITLQPTSPSHDHADYFDRPPTIPSENCSRVTRCGMCCMYTGAERCSSWLCEVSDKGGESFALTATGRLSVTCNGYRAARSSVERGLSHVTSRSHSRDL
jgi:hypothetical protein